MYYSGTYFFTMFFDFSRFFWILTCFISAFATWKYLEATWYAYNNNAVSFVADTTYLDWNTSFVSLSVCEQESPDKLYDSASKFVTLSTAKQRCTVFSWNIIFLFLFLKDVRCRSKFEHRFFFTRHRVLRRCVLLVRYALPKRNIKLYN